MIMNNHNFGSDNKLGDLNTLGDLNKLGNNNTLGDLNTLGNGNKLGNDNKLGDFNKLGYGNTLGDCNVLGTCTKLGNFNTLGDNNTLGDGNKLGNDNTLGKCNILGSHFKFGFRLKMEGVEVINLMTMANIDGSGRQIQIIVHTKGLLIRAGCFVGTLDAFCAKAESENKTRYSKVVRAAAEAFYADVIASGETGGWDE